MTLRIGEQQTTVSAKKTAQQKQSQNIIIDFANLPKKLRTAEMRKKFDKDGDGFLESKNSKGQNEVYIMQQAMGMDLSKYKSNIAKVVFNDGKAEYENELAYYRFGEQFYSSDAYDSNGRKVIHLELGKVRETADYDGNGDYKACHKDIKHDVYNNEIQRTDYSYNGNTNKEVNRIYDKNLNDISKKVDENDGYDVGATTITKSGNTTTKKESTIDGKEICTTTTTKNTSYNGKAGYTKTESKNADGSREVEYKKGTYKENYLGDGESEYIYSKGYHDVTISYDEQNRMIGKTELKESKNTDYNEHHGNLKTTEDVSVKYETQFDKKGNKLEKKTVTDNIKARELARKEDSYTYNDKSEEPENEASTVSYLLNGKTVEPQKVTDNRYEITHDGKTEYFSHDGVLLKQSYVNATETKYNDGRSKKVSPDGKTTWYFVNGKAVTKDEFYKNKPFEVHKDAKGNEFYTVRGEKVKAKRIAYGRFEVTLKNGKKDIYSHDGKLLPQSYLNKQNQSAFDKLVGYFK